MDIFRPVLAPSGENGSHAERAKRVKNSSSRTQTASSQKSKPENIRRIFEKCLKMN